MRGCLIKQARVKVQKNRSIKYPAGKYDWRNKIEIVTVMYVTGNCTVPPGISILPCITCRTRFSTYMISLIPNAINIDQGKLIFASRGNMKEIAAWWSSQTDVCVWQYSHAELGCVGPNGADINRPLKPRHITFFLLSCGIESNPPFVHVNWIYLEMFVLWLQGRASIIVHQEISW